MVFLVQACAKDQICYDAVNWGSPIISVNSNPTPNQYVKSNGYEIMNWQPSGYYLNGKEIYFIVSNSYAYVNYGGGDGFYYNPCNYSSDSSSCNNSYPGNELLYGWGYMFGGNSVLTDSQFAQLMSSNGRCQLCSAKTNDGPCRFYDPSKQRSCYACGTQESYINSCSQASITTCQAAMASDIPVSNNPCFMDHGMGVYLGISSGPSNSPDNNIVGSPVHLGVDELSSSPFFSVGLPTGGVSMPAPAGKCDGGQSCGVYFKMSDKVYSDNRGSIQVELISGIQSGNPGVITKIVSFVESTLCWARSEIFQNLVNESAFQSYIKALLLLYIVIYGITFLMGLVQISQKDLMMRVFKIAVIIQLINPNAWDFFDQNFFQFFSQGIGEITGMIFGSSGDSIGTSIGQTNLVGSDCTCKYMNLTGFQLIDDSIGKLFSSATLAKLAGTMYTNPFWGFFLYITLFVVFCVFVYVTIKSVCFFVLSYLGLSLMIVLAPIFIPFMLFDLTRPLFANWLKFLISYFIQPIIILAFVFFLFQLIMNEVYYLIGYGVCYNVRSSVNIQPQGKDSVAQSDVAGWKPMLGDSELQTIPIPNYHINCDTSKPGCFKNIFKQGCNCQVCEPFQCTGERYINYPYLDPQDARDAARIQEFQKGDLVTFMEIVSLIIMVMFMCRFSELVPEIAKDIAGTPMQMSDMNAAATSMRSGMVSIVKSTASAFGTVANTAIKMRTGIDVGKNIRLTTKAVTKKIEAVRVGIGTARYKAGVYVNKASDVLMLKTPAKYLAKKVANNTLNPYQVAKNINTIANPYSYYKGAKNVYKGAKSAYEGIGKVGTAIANPVKSARYGAKAVGDGFNKYISAPVYKQASEFYNNPWKKTKKVGGSLGSSVGKALFDPNTGKAKPYRPWVQSINSARDSVGGFIDTMYHAPRRAMSQKAHDYTLGVIGSDHSQQERDLREDGKLTYSDRVAEQHRMNMEKIPKMFRRR